MSYCTESKICLQVISWKLSEFATCRVGFGTPLHASKLAVQGGVDDHTIPCHAIPYHTMEVNYAGASNAILPAQVMRCSGQWPCCLHSKHGIQLQTSAALLCFDPCGTSATLCFCTVRSLDECWSNPASFTQKQQAILGDHGGVPASPERKPRNGQDQGIRHSLQEAYSNHVNPSQQR